MRDTAADEAQDVKGRAAQASSTVKGQATDAADDVTSTASGSPDDERAELQGKTPTHMRALAVGADADADDGRNFQQGRPRPG